VTNPFPPLVNLQAGSSGSAIPESRRPGPPLNQPGSVGPGRLFDTGLARQLRQALKEDALSPRPVSAEPEQLVAASFFDMSLARQLKEALQYHHSSPRVSASSRGAEPPCGVIISRSRGFSAPGPSPYSRGPGPGVAG
jgi:hypothetical protein